MEKLIIALTVLSLALSPGRTQTLPIKGDFALKNVHTGKYVRIKDANGANGTPIVAYSPVNWKCVTWHFQPADKGGYTLKNLFSGKTLQPLQGEAKAGVAMEEQPLKDQQYELIAAGDQQYYIRVKGTDLYLTPGDPGGATNSSIILETKQTGDLQRWTLVEQNPTM
ncbi:RICIN domain-containing protein [Flavitalea sp. BT771]|uniref:RICIN domain-containing protein n=1 Tax=Flavitalea sp. BT771 TaxID=3063329 RepID=UPI0026E388D0|nr:RICIN domain-containing protein [Flavitalea sp. BT771]MDO6432994.1 RICIN domain-containing protein [Flavitalea sp. BT771]MDV6221730.1 RICIN domain-containing protein [Flavitalea sp. BT771]